MAIPVPATNRLWQQTEPGIFVLGQWVKIATAKLPWHKKSPGVFTKFLAHDAATGLRVELYKIKPKTTLTPHRHSNFEWVYVLEGELRDEFGIYPKGSFKINPKNSIHTSTSTKGCVLLVTGAGDYQSVK